MKIGQFTAIAVLAVALFRATASADVALRTQMLDGMEFSVPDGFILEVLHENLTRPRMIEFAPNGDMLIGSSTKVYLLKPPYETVTRYLSIDGYPHSVAIRDDELFVATTTALLKAPYDPDATSIRPEDLTRVARLPGGFGHSSRTVEVGPYGSVFVSLGISGNCSDEHISSAYEFRDRKGGVLRLVEAGSESYFEAFATGLRNPVGFDFHPQTGVMYAVNNGPDHWGFEQPPEYFSRLDANSFHGMPWFQYDGENVLSDPCIATRPPKPASDVVVPVATFPARNAPLGMDFVPASTMGEAFEMDAVVALHGSWATQPDGDFLGPEETRRPPAVVLVSFDDNGEATGAVETVIGGFQLEDGRRIARPADVEVGPDGALYITSDGGMIEGVFRLRRK